MALDSYTDVKNWALAEASEATDGSSGLDTFADTAMLAIWRDLITRWPWLSLRKSRPGVILTSAKITTLTLTIAAAGSSVAGTLSATYATSLAGYKIVPGGADYSLRITAHTAGTSAVTLDAAPAALSAVACVIFQDEYDTASDLGVFVDGLWTGAGDFVEIVSEDFLRREYPDPPSEGWPPICAARIAPTKVRLSSYPGDVKRLEYPYNYEPTDPSGASALAIGSNLRPIYSTGVLGRLLKRKRDQQAAAAREEYEAGLQGAQIYEERMLVPPFSRSSGGHRLSIRRRAPYG